MSATSLDVFDTTLHKTNILLNDLMGALGTEDRHEAYTALRATLHALRDRLGVEEVAQLGAQLPLLIRGLYYEGWDPTAKPVRERHLEQFLDRISREIRGNHRLDPEQAARAVFIALAEHVSSGEIDDIKSALPAEIRRLWP